VADPGSGTRRPPNPTLERAAAILLIAGSVSLALDTLRTSAATTDEPVHIAAGVESVREGTGRWNPEHPPLAKLLAGLALTGLDLRPPESPLDEGPTGPRLFRFLFENRTPGETILFRARLPFVGLLALLLLGVRALGRRLFGPAGGLLALAFAALNPNLVAHAGVVQTDVAVTAFVLLSLGPLASLREPADHFAAPLLGLLWGLAFLSKYSAPLLIVCLAPVALVAALQPAWRRTGLRASVPRRIAGATLVALLVVVSGFVFAYRNQSPEDRDAVAQDRLLTRGGSPESYRIASALGKISGVAANVYIGPESVRLQSRKGAGVNYFLGRVSIGGSPLYFPVALLVKTPLALLLAALAGAVLSGGRRTGAAVAASLALFLAVSAGTTYNIGVRHLLFAFPLLSLLAAALAAGGRGLVRPVAAAGLFLALAAEVLPVHPFEMSFFNAAAGGAEGGRRFFADSNLDWGQDLRRLAFEAPGWSSDPIPSVVFGGDLPRRYPTLRPVAPGDEDRPGAVIALGEQPFAIGPELLRSKGSVRDAERLARLREALSERGERVGSVGGSIGIWRIVRPPGAPPETRTPR